MILSTDVHGQPMLDDVIHAGLAYRTENNFGVDLDRTHLYFSVTAIAGSLHEDTGLYNAVGYSNNTVLGREIVVQLSRRLTAAFLVLRKGSSSHSSISCSDV